VVVVDCCVLVHKLRRWSTRQAMYSGGRFTPSPVKEEVDEVEAWALGCGCNDNGDELGNGPRDTSPVKSRSDDQHDCNKQIKTVWEDSAVAVSVVSSSALHSSCVDVEEGEDKGELSSKVHLDPEQAGTGGGGGGGEGGGVADRDLVQRGAGCLAASAPLL
jgi:hypothetical protein